MKSRRILFTAEVGPPIRNGVVISMETFARGLQEIGHKVTLLVPKYAESKQRANYLYYRQIPAPFPYARGYGLAVLAPVKAAIRQHPPDIIHTQHMFTTGEFGLRLARSLKIPIVHTYHTYLMEYAHYALVPGARRFLKAYSVHYANRVDQVIAPSSMIRDLLKSLGVTTPIAILPTGIDPESFPTRRKHALTEVIRSRYQIPRSAKILLYVGRLVKEKNIDLLLEMLTLVVKKDPKVVLLFLGPGEPANFAEYADRLGVMKSVRFLGPKKPDEVKEHLVASDIFVFGSTTDTQGIVILEAMAAGCVPVAVNVGGPIDIIKDKYDGRLSSPFSRDFADHVLALLHNRSHYQHLKTNALKKAKRFSYLHQAEELAEIYASLIAKKSTV